MTLTGNISNAAISDRSARNATDSDHTCRNVGERLRHAARANTDRVAVLTNAGACTYADLDRNVDRVAFRVSPFVQPEPQRIALLFDQGAPAITAILGVLRAGLMYVSLDVHDPPARLQRVLDDAEPVAILTSTEQAELARSLAPDRCAVLNLDDDQHADPPADWAPPSVDPDTPAYILYTSGSTGEPKGVVQTHRNLMHFVDRYTDTLGVTPEDRMTMLYALSFSAANMDVYGALSRGATLCLYDVKQRGLSGLNHWLRDNSITILHTIPTLFRHLCQNLPDGATFDQIRAIDLGGEPVFASDLDLLRAHFPPHTILINHLAATEASVIAQHVVRADADVPRGALAAGAIAPGVTVTIEREDKSPADVDEVGEVVIRSRYLSPGYWRRPDLTRKAFNNDDGNEPGIRSYRSGDLGRFDADVLLYIAGRRDSRVKIRGHSVAIGEVEAAIRSIATIADAVVVATDDTNETRLAAYIVTPETDAATIRRQTAALLPPYMIPAEFIRLDELPRTATGKIDRRSLTGPDRPRPAADHTAARPQTQFEKDIAAIYTRILGITTDTVGRDDNFFELGGDSLLIVQLQTEVKQSFACDLSLADLLRDPTVAGVAATIEQQLALAASSATTTSNSPPIAASPLIVPVRETGAHPPLFLVHGALGQAFISPAFLDALGDDQPLYAIQAQGVDGAQPPHRTVTEMAAAYVSAMRHVQPDGPYLIGGICGGSIVAHEMACQMQRDDARIAPLLLFDPPRPPRSRNALSRFIRTARIRRELRTVGSPRQSRASSKIARRLRHRVDEGKMRLTDNSADTIHAGVRVTLNFRLALLNHQLNVWHGDACVLGSRERIQQAWNAGHWSRFVTGNVKLVEVAAHHTDVLDPTAPDFAPRLAECLEFMHTSMPRDPRHTAVASDRSFDLDHPTHTHKMPPTDAG